MLLTGHPGAVEARGGEAGAQDILQGELAAFDPGALVGGRKQNYGEHDQAQHGHDYQQRDQNSAPVPLIRRRRHQLLEHKLAISIYKKRDYKSPSKTCRYM